MPSAQPIAGPMPHTEQWDRMRLFDPERAERPIVFGASEAAEACDESPYSAGPLELYLKKRGEKPPVASNEAMEMGLLLEPVVLILYARRTGNDVRSDLPMYFHGERSFMGATPDGIVEAGEGKDPVLGVDAKTSTFRRYAEFDAGDNQFGSEWTDELPVDYVLQAQHQMEVMNWRRVDFPVLFDGRTMRIYSVDRHQDLIDNIVACERELAERIVNADPPEPNWSHAGTKKVLQELHGYAPGSVTDLDVEDLTQWNRYSDLGQQIKDLEATRRECSNKLLHKMGESELGRFPQGQKELRRVIVQDTMYTEKDIATAQSKLGQVKRRGHERLLIRKVK